MAIECEPPTVQLRDSLPRVAVRSLRKSCTWIVEEMRWDMVGYALGVACSQTMEGYRYWGDHLPELFFVDDGHNCELSAIYTLSMKVLDSHPMLTMFHTSSLCGGLSSSEGHTSLLCGGTLGMFRVPSTGDRCSTTCDGFWTDV